MCARVVEPYKFSVLVYHYGTNVSYVGAGYSTVGLWIYGPALYDCPASHYKMIRSNAHVIMQQDKT